MKTFIKYITIAFALISLSANLFAAGSASTSLTISVGETLTDVTSAGNISNNNRNWSIGTSGNKNIATVEVTTSYGKKPVISVTGTGIGTTTYVIINDSKAGEDTGLRFTVTITVSSIHFTSDDINYEVYKTNEVRVIAGSYAGEIGIPAKVSYSDADYDVTAIADSAFLKSTTLTSIILKSNSLVALGKDSFNSNLATIYVPVSIAHDYYTNAGWSSWAGKVGVLVDVASSGYATLYCEKNLIVPTGVQAFGYQYNSTDKKLYAESAISAGSVLPANVGFVVKASAGTLKFKSTASAAGAYTSVLSGSATPLSATPAGEIYVLGTVGSNTTFYKYTGTGIPAGKAYYKK